MLCISCTTPPNNNASYHKPSSRDISHPISIVLLVLFFLYTFFVLKSHARLYDEEIDPDQENDTNIRSGPIKMFAVFALVVTCTAFCSMHLIKSASHIAKNGKPSKTFIGAVIIPVVSHSAERVASCESAAKNILNLSAGIAFGNSLNVLLLTTPLLVLLGWTTGQPMTLQFKMFEVVVLLLTVMVISYVVQEGKSNYFSGAMCLGLYVETDPPPAWTFWPF